MLHLSPPDLLVPKLFHWVHLKFSLCIILVDSWSLVAIYHYYLFPIIVASPITKLFIKGHRWSNITHLKKKKKVFPRLEISNCITSNLGTKCNAFSMAVGSVIRFSIFFLNFFFSDLLHSLPSWEKELTLHSKIAFGKVFYICCVSWRDALWHFCHNLDLTEHKGMKHLPTVQYSPSFRRQLSLRLCHWCFCDSFSVDIFCHFSIYIFKSKRVCCCSKTYLNYFHF